MSKILNFIFKNSLIRFSLYRNLVNKIYQFIKYDNNYFLKPKKNILELHKKNLYLKKVKERHAQNLYLKNENIDFNNNINNNFLDFFNVEVTKMTSVLGSRFSSGYDPLCNTALQIIQDDNTETKNLYLYKYLNNFFPKDYNEVFLINQNTALKKITQYNFFYPWFHDYPSRVLHNGLFGPKHIETTEIRVTRLKNIYNLIDKYSYIPSKKDCIEGYVLIDNDDYRFVVTSGTHRSSVLNAMNILDKFPNKVPVKFDQIRVDNKTFIINKKSAKNWPAVKSGFLKIDEANLFFESFFKDKKYL